jgi:predicted RNA-binding Zn-ribbon protein involved in translation (DUF1610 family)
MTMNVEATGHRIARMTCPECGATMNPHAEKAVALLSAEDVAHADPALDGLVEEIHQCPLCGWVEARRTILDQ